MLLFDQTNRLNDHRFSGFARSIGLELGDLIDDIHSLDHLAEDRVLAVEEARVAVHDEELRASRVGVLRAGHRQDAALVVDVVELGGDVVARVARSGLARRALLAVRAAALDHEVAHDPVEGGAVVEALLRELQEALDVLRGLLGEEGHDHGALVGDEGSFDGRVIGRFEVHFADHRARSAPRSRLLLGDRQHDRRPQLPHPQDVGPAPGAVHPLHRVPLLRDRLEPRREPGRPLRGLPPGALRSRGRLRAAELGDGGHRRAAEAGGG